MKERLLAWRASATVAHVAPLLVFMLLSSVVGLCKTENSALPWYISAPEHWLYPLQCGVVLGLLWWLRGHYTFKPWRGLAWAVLFGLLGIAVWVLPAWWYVRAAVPTPPAWWEWLGLVDRLEGFDPTIFPVGGAAYCTTVGLRFLRMVLVVPLVEELCWRGWLMRYVQAGEKSFTKVPFGRHSWRAFWVVTLAVVFIHQSSDWAAAFVWGSLMYVLAVRTRSLGACVVMHAVGNLLLGLYVMKTQQWGFW